jgi:DNA polymerase-3 subunit alpha
LKAVPAALELGQRVQREKASGQVSLLESLEEPGEGSTRPRRLPEAEPWSDGHALAMEKDVLGLYVTGHPLARYEREIHLFATGSVADIAEMEDGEPVRLGGIITHIKTTTDRKGERMAFVTLEDFTGRVEVVVFSGCFARRQQEVHRDAAVIVEGKVSTREEEEPKILAADVVPLGQAYQRFVERVILMLSTAGLEESLLEEIRAVLGEHPGRVPVDIEMRTAEDEVVTISASGIRVEPSRELLERLGPLIGESNIGLKGAAQGGHAPDPGF